MKRALAVLVVLLALPAVALPALAVAYHAASTTGGGVVPCVAGATLDGAPCLPEPGPAASYRGDSSRCVQDPSGTSGCVTPTLAHLYTQIEATFGHQPAACWSPRGGDPRSDHPQGRACDYTIGRIGTYPNPTDTARGWQLAHWLHDNATALHIDYVIWQGRIWSQRRAAEGWRAYTGGGYYPSTGPTFGHHDHVHVSVTEKETVGATV